MSEQDIKINIGCGAAAAEGWMNIDKSPNAWLAKHKLIRWLLRTARVLPPSSYKDHYRDDLVIRNVAKSGIPAPDASASWIYSSHLIGSMTREGTRCLLRECFRVLKPGGKIRLCTPDLRYVAQGWHDHISAYLANDRSHFAQANSERPIGDLLVGSMQLAAYAGPVHHLSRINHFPIRHYYDLDSLSHILEESGFTNVAKHSFRESECPDLAIIEPREGHLFIEAEKSGNQREAS
jgi:SAM-dependent methyltransferase